MGGLNNFDNFLRKVEFKISESIAVKMTCTFHVKYQLFQSEISQPLTSEGIQFA